MKRLFFGVSESESLEPEDEMFLTGPSPVSRTSSSTSLSPNQPNNQQQQQQLQLQIQQQQQQLEKEAYERDVQQFQSQVTMQREAITSFLQRYESWASSPNGNTTEQSTRIKTPTDSCANSPLQLPTRVEKAKKAVRFFSFMQTDDNEKNNESVSDKNDTNDNSMNENGNDDKSDKNDKNDKNANNDNVGEKKKKSGGVTFGDDDEDDFRRERQNRNHSLYENIKTPVASVDMLNMFDLDSDDEDEDMEKKQPKLQNDKENNANGDDDHHQTFTDNERNGTCEKSNVVSTRRHTCQQKLVFEGYEYGDCYMNCDDQTIQSIQSVHWKYFVYTGRQKASGLVVLLNNFAESIDAFAPVAKHLVSQGFHVIAIQLEYHKMFGNNENYGYSNNNHKDNSNNNNSNSKNHMNNNNSSNTNISRSLCKYLSHIVRDSDISHLLKSQKLFICGNGLGASMAIRLISHLSTLDEPVLQVSGLVLLAPWIVDHTLVNNGLSSGIRGILSGNYVHYSSIGYIQQLMTQHHRDIGGAVTNQDTMFNIVQFCHVTLIPRTVITVPVFVACGNYDTVTSRSTMLHYYRSSLSNCPIKQIKFYESKHALLRDQSLTEVISDVSNWIHSTLLEI